MVDPFDLASGQSVAFFRIATEQLRAPRAEGGGGGVGDCPQSTMALKLQANGAQSIPGPMTPQKGD